ncbi:MAG: aspartate/glutamate racemase family protein [Rhizobiaceae bacterium]|nr:aspartate/glutamate racemase family protein [Rhizobiaceae bacterium]
MRILVVNPNTTASMTATISEAAREAASAGTEIVAVTSRMGPASIEGYYDEALAVPGMLAEVVAAGDAIDAVVIACFDDTGLDAARALADVPVLGICEAALSLAGFIAARMSVVTTMDRSRVPIENLVHRYGFSGRAKVRSADIAVLSLEDPASGARDKLRREIGTAIAEDRAEAIVLGCAGMADLVRSLRQEFGLPVVDGVAAAVKQAEALVSLGLNTSKRGAYATPIRKPVIGMPEYFARS